MLGRFGGDYDNNGRDDRLHYRRDFRRQPRDCEQPYVSSPSTSAWTAPAPAEWQAWLTVHRPSIYFNPALLVYTGYAALAVVYFVLGFISAAMLLIATIRIEVSGQYQ